MVKELREKYSLHLLLDIAGLKKSTYFYALEHLDYKEDKDKEIGDLIVKIFNDNHKKYGRPRIVLELKRMGFVINNKKVYRLMKERGLTVTPRKRKYSSYNGKIGKICRNHLLKKRLNKNIALNYLRMMWMNQRPKKPFSLKLIWVLLNIIFKLVRASPILSGNNLLLI